MRNILLLLLAVFVYTEKLNALVVNIDADAFKPLPVAIIGFDNVKVSNGAVKSIEKVIADDLNSTFVFLAKHKNKELDELSLAEKKQELLNQGFLFMVTGGAYKANNGDIGVMFELYDLVENNKLISYRYTLGKKLFKEQSRYIAHDIANEIYKEFTLQDSFFSTKVVFVEGGSIKTADFDFNNIKTVYKNNNAIVINPRISPDESKIAFLKIDKSTGISTLAILNTTTGSVENVKHESGTVLSPSFSKDNSRLLFSVARDRSANIYEFNFRSKSVLKITDSYSINVSPSYSPKDQNEIIFTSDRHGQPQIFTVTKQDKTPKRLTNILAGSYYTPSWSPNGKYIAFTKIVNSRFFVGVIDLETKEEKLLTSDRYAEGPTWSSDSRQIAYQAKKDGKYKIMFVDVRTGKKKSFNSKKSLENPYWYKTTNNLKGVIKSKVM